MKNIKVSRNANGAELRGFLAENLEMSNRQAKDLLDQRNVFVNGRRVWMARHTLKTGDLVEIAVLEPAPASAIPILFRDRCLLAVSKPSGILTDRNERSLEQEMRFQLSCPELLAVHRLDRDTTGCVLLAFSKHWKNQMIQQFKACTVKKTYHAIVEGHPEEPSFTVQRSIEGLHAVSHFRLLKKSVSASLLEIRIETGRTHQVRKHLTSVGLHLAGERHYDSRKKPAQEFKTVPRQMLHARSLGFEHPETGSGIEITAPYPADFRETLSRLGLSKKTRVRSGGGR